MDRVEDIRDRPLRYLGRGVTVIGTVEQVLGERAFELEGDGVVWPKKLLVLARAPVRFGPTQLEDGEELVVSGTVQPMAPEVIDQALGQSVDPVLAARYRDQVVLVADSVRLIETQARWSKPYQQGAIVSAIRLLSGIDPATFAGHSVDLANVPVRAVAGQGLWIGFGPRSELFVVPLRETELVGIAPGDHVAIRGTVRELAAGAEAAQPAALAPARARGEKVYVEAAQVTKLTPRPST
ncbi:MAG TPA: hypothetical protein VNO30_38320 [Kofleriaceae bacterium]|nr:hypothetical protein [Kofleriaceae bacterium]